MYGTMGGVPPDDYRLARAIVLWGVNPSATGIHLVPQVNARAARRRIRRRDRSAPHAARAQRQPAPAPRPGTDVVLALAMINELFRRGHADRTFLAAHVDGFDDARRTPQRSIPCPAPPRSAAISERDIATLVEPTPPRRLRSSAAAGASSATATAATRCARCSRCRRSPASSACAAAAMTMSLGRTLRSMPTALARPDRSADRATPGQHEPARPRAHRAATPPDPRAVRLQRQPGRDDARTRTSSSRGLAREDLFTVVHDQVLTDTARFADVVLPATTFFEQTELHKSYGHYFLQYSEPVIGRGRRIAQQPGGVRAAGARRSASTSRRCPPGDRRRCCRQRSTAPAPLGDSVRRTCAHDAVALRFGRSEPIQFGTDFPDDREWQGRALPRLDRDRGRLVPRRPPESDLIPSRCSARRPTRRSTRSSASSTAAVRARSCIPTIAAARGCARAPWSGSSTTSARCTLHAVRRTDHPPGHGDPAEGPVAIEHAERLHRDGARPRHAHRHRRRRLLQRRARAGGDARVKREAPSSHSTLTPQHSTLRR